MNKPGRKKAKTDNVNAEQNVATTPRTRAQIAKEAAMKARQAAQEAEAAAMEATLAAEAAAMKKQPPNSSPGPSTRR